MHPPPEDPDALLRLGQQEYEAGRLDRAAAALQRALELGESRAQGAAAFLLGLVRLKQLDREDAYAAWRLAIVTEDPEYAPRAACFLAIGYQQEGNRAEARRAWQLVLDTASQRYEMLGGAARAAPSRCSHCWGLAASPIRRARLASRSRTGVERRPWS